MVLIELHLSRTFNTDKRKFNLNRYFEKFYILYIALAWINIHAFFGALSSCVQSRGVQDFNPGVCIELIQACAGV